MMDDAHESVRELILNALQELHQHSSETARNQWFTRKEIARQLNTSDLNPTRKKVIDEVVAEGAVAGRNRPNDMRKTKQYRLAHPVSRDRSEAKTEPEITSVPVFPKSDQAYLEDSFYTALFSYLRRLLPENHNLQYVPNDLSADQWLAQARKLAAQFRRHYQDNRLSKDLTDVVAWAKQGKIQQARTFVLNREAEVVKRIAED